MPKPVASAPVGMEKPELRHMLILAKKEPMHTAFALGADGRAIIILDKRKPPRTLEKMLKDGAPDARSFRFGTAAVDPDEPVLVRFVVNKVSTGMAKKLTVALKGTGFKKVEVAVEDGSGVEAAQEDDEPAEPAAAEPAARSPAPDRDGPDAAQLTAALTALVKRLSGVIAADPSKRIALVELATDAQASLKQGNLEKAAAGIEVLREVLEEKTPQAATGPAAADDGETNPGTQSMDAPPAKTAAVPAGPGVQRVQKARQAWTATRARVEAQLRSLLDNIVAAHDDDVPEGLEGELRSAFSPVLDNLDESLAHTLAEAERASEAAEAARLVQNARATVAEYQRFVASSPVIQHLDRNPFADLAIAETLAKTLGVLDRSLR